MIKKESKADEQKIEEEDLSQRDDESEAEEEDLPDLLAEKEKEAAEIYDKYLRTLAEFDNFRKRTAKEKAGMYDDGVRDTVEKLLPVIDNFERAFSSVTTDKEDSFYKGVAMTLKQMQDFLDNLGVEVIDSIGETFEPSKHFAVAHVTGDEYGENEVIEEMQKGYMYKEKIIRCSMVKVAN